MEFRVKSGNIHMGLLSAELMNLGGKPCIISVLKDITERKQVELALQESEDFSSNLLRNIPIPILVVNTNNSIRYVNPALETITGYSYEELVGKKPPYPWHTGTNGITTYDDLTRSHLHGLKRSEERFIDKDRKAFWVETNTVAIKRNGKVKYHIASWFDITEQRQRRENMEYYISEVTRAQEEERKRIARELHDETIQTLSSLYLDVEKTATMKGELSQKAIKELRRIRSRIDSALDEVRRFSNELRPGLLDRFGLIPSLELLVKEVSASSDIMFNLKVNGDKVSLSEEADLALFRITQEAINNIKRHSEATTADITLVFEKNHVKLFIKDNGKGFSMMGQLNNLARIGKLGLIGINERTRLLSGTFSYESEEGKGTTLKVEVPL
jgi:PAS domain S-box-containing protein